MQIQVSETGWRSCVLAVVLENAFYITRMVQATATVLWGNEIFYFLVLQYFCVQLLFSVLKQYVANGTSRVKKYMKQFY